MTNLTKLKYSFYHLLIGLFYGNIFHHYFGAIFGAGCRMLTDKEVWLSRKGHGLKYQNRLKHIINVVLGMYSSFYAANCATVRAQLK